MIEADLERSASGCMTGEQRDASDERVRHAMNCSLVLAFGEAERSLRAEIQHEDAERKVATHLAGGVLRLLISRAAAPRRPSRRSTIRSSVHLRVSRTPRGLEAFTDPGTQRGESRNVHPVAS
jgi:hypothetical protein